MRILISGTCEASLNSNYGLIKAITFGFQELNEHEVKLVSVSKLTEAISHWKPQITLLVGGMALETIPLALVYHLCRQVKSKLAFWSLEDPYELDWVVQKGEIFDLICTTDFSSQCFYPGTWCVKHLPLASPNRPAPQTGKRLQEPGRWLFCGVPFKNRIRWIEGIQRIYPDGLLIGPNWPSFNRPTRVSRQRISHEILMTLYKTIPITLSIGRRHNLANKANVSPSTPGPRLFEAAGCGATQLVCDSGLEIRKYYEPDHDFLWARNIDEAYECLQKASMDPEIVEQYGRRAWLRTQAEHLYSHRAKQMLSWIWDL